MHVCSSLANIIVEQVNVPAEVTEAPAPVEETVAAPEAAPAPEVAPAAEAAPAPVPAIPTREMVAIPDAAPAVETKVRTWSISLSFCFSVFHFLLIS